MNQQITLQNEKWNVINTGETYKNGIFCHLSNANNLIHKFAWVNINLIKESK